MLFVITWASASSHTSRGASVHSAAQSRKLEQNPYGTAPDPGGPGPASQSPARRAGRSGTEH